MNHEEENEIREIYRKLIPANRNTLLLIARSTITTQENTKQYELDTQKPPKDAA
jgi:hypothetical protein